MSAYRASSAVLTVLPLIVGCALDAGEPFATLTPRLESRVEISAGRDLGMGWQKLASNYEIRIDELVIDAEPLVLLDSGVGAVGFDPANPPPGYSLCHNGHCHADSGALVDYEDIAAELAQGSGATAVVALPTGNLDLIVGVSRALNCEPSCALPLANIGLATMAVTRIRGAGLVRDGNVPARVEGEQSWSLSFDFDPNTGDDGDALTLSTALSLPADREHAPDVAMTAEFLFTSVVFDDVAWDALATPFDPSADAEQRIVLLGALSELELAFDIER